MSLDYSDTWNYHIINGTLFRTLKSDAIVTYMYWSLANDWFPYGSTTRDGIIIDHATASKSEVLLELL
jgi:hypothetical protein